jgi:hypothetical protein
MKKLWERALEGREVEKAAYVPYNPRAKRVVKYRGYTRVPSATPGYWSYQHRFELSCGHVVTRCYRKTTACYCEFCRRGIPANA